MNLVYNIWISFIAIISLAALVYFLSSVQMVAWHRTFKQLNKHSKETEK